MVSPNRPERQGTHGLFTRMPPSSPSSVSPPTRPHADRALRRVVVLAALVGTLLALLIALALRLGPFATLASVPADPPAPPSADSALARLTPPLRGFVSRGLDPAIGHFGVDVAVPTGTPVHAAAPGQVLLSDSTREGGLTLVLAHPQGLVTVYKHNDRLLVRAGDLVSAGMPIALSGSTGRLTTGPHLHFEAWRAGQPLDVRALVEETETVR
jgi:murein DD-endopeptidase MepM/ murein hydrolase activator NlpD